MGYCDQHAATHSRKGETEPRRPRQKEHGEADAAPPEARAFSGVYILSSEVFHCRPGPGCV